MSVASPLIKEEEEHIKRVLPLLLKRDVQFRREINVILTETFPTREEMKQILDEIRIFRKETQQKFEAADKRFEAIIDELRIFRKETQQKFEATDKRFEEMHKEMRLGFEAADKRFEEMHKEMHLGFEITNKRIDEQGKRIDEQGKTLTKSIEKVGMSVRTIGSRWGIEAEVTIRNTLRELLLKKLNISTVSEWKTKDTKGIVGVPNSDIQADLLQGNGEHILAEIKSSADTAHVNRFYKVGELYTEKEKVKPKLLFIAVMMDEKGKRLCEELGIQLITYDELQ
mgnify:CR=1 FL=1